MGDDDKKVSDYVDVTYPEGRNVPVDRPPSRGPYMPPEGWLTVSNLRFQLSGLYCHVWGDLANSSDLPYEAGSLLFKTSAEGNRRDYQSGHVIGEQAHSAETVEHYSTEAVPAKGSVTLLLGTIGLDPGYYEVKVRIEDPKTGQVETNDAPMLQVEMPGERQQPEYGSSYPINSGRVGPNDVRVQITQVVDLGAAQDGNHEYGVHFKLDVLTADEQGQPNAAAERPRGDAPRPEQPGLGGRGEPLAEQPRARGGVGGVPPVGPHAPAPLGVGHHRRPRPRRVLHRRPPGPGHARRRGRRAGDHQLQLTRRADAPADVGQSRNGPTKA